MKHRAQITDWLAVGSREACASSTDELVIHIFRSDCPGQESKCAHGPSASHLRMDFREGDKIGTNDLRNLNTVIRSLRERKRRTLVHCFAGRCRSVHVAIYLLVVLDGMRPFEALSLVASQIHAQREGEVIDPRVAPFEQIVRVWESIQSAGVGQGAPCIASTAV